jgi:hypothetical protein
MKKCFYCEQDKEDIRPYGPGGSYICFDCTISTPEREALAHAQFDLQMEAAAQHSSVVVVGEDGGVRPATQDEINEAMGNDALDSGIRTHLH